MNTKIRELILRMAQIKEYKELVTYIIDSTIQSDEKNSINNMTIRLNELFNLDASVMLEFINDNQILSANLLELDEEYNEQIEFMNFIKNKYRYKLIKRTTAESSPLLINEVQITRDITNDTNIMTVIRADGESLYGNYSFATLISIMSLLSRSAMNLLLDQKGVSIDINSLQQYLNESKSLNDKLNSVFPSGKNGLD